VFCFVVVGVCVWVVFFCWGGVGRRWCVPTPELVAAARAERPDISAQDLKVDVVARARALLSALPVPDQWALAYDEAPRPTEVRGQANGLGVTCGLLLINYSEVSLSNY